MGYFPHFIMRRGTLVLWQEGHYQYKITRGNGPFSTVKVIMDSCEEAVKIFQTIT